MSLFVYSYGKKAKNNSIANQAYMIVKTAEKFHYAPRAMNDSLSEIVFESFLQILDPNASLFTKKIYNSLEKYKYSLDEQIVQKKTTFLNAVTELYIQQLKYADSIIQALHKKKFDFTEKDTLWLGGDNVYEKQSVLSGKWDRWTKYMILSSYQSRSDSLDNAKNITKEETITILSDVISREKCRIQSKLSSYKKTKKQIGENYLKAIASAFDPHTTYFSFSEKKQFETYLSTATGSFGIQVYLNTIGEIEIIKMIPGAPAWNSNKINEGDIILDIEKSNGEKMDMRCTSPSGVYDFISSIGSKKTSFKIRKKDGKIVSVILKKEIIDVEMNTIRSFLFKGTQTIGYIYLPSFYTSFSFNNYLSKGCANDLTMELIKLRKDSIDGLILDLRSNEGGFVNEALRIAGVFIDKGALCITHERGKKPKAIKDNARGIVYSNPLVVLVNSSSASASELLAATLQDYNRAVIVGSKTFGKSTIQSVLPVDAGNYDSLSLYKGVPPAFIKITLGGLYRVSGDSYQNIGITPDIELPELFENMQIKEVAYNTSLQFKKITKKTYSYPKKPLPVTKLKNLSSSRLKRNPAFKYVEKIKPMIPDLNSRFSIPLEFNAFKKFINRFEVWGDILDAFGCSTAVILPDYINSDNSMNDIVNKQYQEIIQDISSDIYINEAVNIINDLIQTKTED